MLSSMFVHIHTQVLGTPLHVKLPTGLSSATPAHVGVRFTAPSSSSAVQVRVCCCLSVCVLLCVFTSLSLQLILKSAVASFEHTTVHVSFICSGLSRLRQQEGHTRTCSLNAR